MSSAPDLSGLFCLIIRLQFPSFNIVILKHPKICSNFSIVIHVLFVLRWTFSNFM
jgi:hypothetical protein